MGNADSACQVATPNHIFHDFDTPTQYPSWLTGTATIVENPGWFLGTPSASGQALLVTGDNNTLGQGLGIATSIEFVLSQPVYITTLTAWVYNSQANFTTLQLHELDAAGNVLNVFSIGGGTGSRTLGINRLISQRFIVYLHKSSFPSTATIGFDNLQINVNPSLSSSPTPGATLTATPTFTASPIPNTCNIKFTTNFNIRERGNRYSAILGQVQEGALYAASFKTEATQYTVPQSWVQIQLSSGLRGWVQATSGANLYIDSSTQSCYNSLQVYTGNFPQQWKDVAQITQADIQLTAGTTQSNLSLVYLYLEGKQDPALLLARLAVSEADGTKAQDNYLREVEYVSWIIRMRSFMGLLNYSPGTVYRTLEVPGLSALVFIQGTGQSGNTLDVVDDIIFSVLLNSVTPTNISEINHTSPGYQPISVFTKYPDPSQMLVGGQEIDNLYSGFYPRDVFELEILYDAYQRTRIILNVPWSQFNTNLIGFDGWVAGASQLISRPNPPAGTPVYYPPRVPLNQPNQQNSFYDQYDLDDFFFTECVSNGHGLDAQVFPMRPFALYQKDGYLLSILPTPPIPAVRCN